MYVKSEEVRGSLFLHAIIPRVSADVFRMGTQVDHEDFLSETKAHLGQYSTRLQEFIVDVQRNSNR